MQLIFATHNENKVKEIQSLLPANIKIVSLKEININADIPETADTLEGNAQLKVNYIFKILKTDCFADDTGLEIEALNNEPGIYSARYAGEEKDPDANMNKVLKGLNNVSNRSARFRTVIALIFDGKEHLFEGIINGTISTEKRGGKGFGYDPIFIPNIISPLSFGEGPGVRSFAEMSLEEKNKISHRAIAIQKLVSFLKQAGGG